MIILNLLYISIIWVLILDIAGFAHTIDKTLYKIFYRGRAYREDAHFPPFDCSLCLTFWTGLIYLLIIQSLTIPHMLLLLVFACLTPIIKDLFILIKDIVVKLIDLIYRLFKL